MNEAGGQNDAPHHAWCGAAGGGGEGRRAPGGWTLLLVWAVLGLWSVCLWVISGRALGCCWSGMMETAAAELLALAIALAAPGVFVNVMFSAAMLLRPGKALAMRVFLASPRTAGPVRRAKAPMRVLAMSAVACAIGGLLSTFGVAAAATGLQKLATLFVYPAWTWAVVRVAVAVVLMLPLAAGAAGVALVALLLRRRSAGDDCGRAIGEMLAGLAAGLALAAAAWWLGANLLTVAFGCAAALVVAAMVSGTRGLEPAGGSGPQPPRPGMGRRRQRWLSALLWAALAWGLTLQCRALRDAVGTDWSGTWLWAAAAAALMALTWLIQARAGAEIRDLDAAAAALAAALVAVVQTALIVFAVGRGPDRWIWIGLAAAGLGPLAMLAATVLARRRRLFVESGCSRRLLLADAAGASAAGMLGALWMLTWPTTGRTIIAAALAILTAFALAGGRAAARRRSSHAGGRLPWAVMAAALIVAAALVSLAAVRSARATLGPDVAVGASLTAVQTRAGSVRALPLHRPLPRSGTLTALARRIINARPGRWWVVPGSQPEVLEGLADGVRAGVYFAEPAIRRLPVFAGRGQRANFQHYLNIQTRLLDGVYLAGPRADDPEAWCVLSRDVLQRCMTHLSDSGVMMLHIRADAAALAELLAAARTFEAVAGEATAAVTVAGRTVEMLMVAPAWDAPAGTPAELADPGQGARVIPLAELLSGLAAPGPKPISALAPRSWTAPAPGLEEFTRLLEQTTDTRPAGE